MGRLADKVAIITGGAGGIGSAIAAGFAREGARVVVADLSLSRCEDVCGQIGGKALAQLLDVRDMDSIDAMIEWVVLEAGGIDILVNCAGVFGMQKIVDLTPEEFDRVNAVNARGLIFTVAAVARQMIKGRRGGAIINITSGAARRGPAGAVAYATSKAGVVAMTQCAAQELIPDGIRVNAIAPGAVRTPMWEEVKVIYPAAMGIDIGDIEALQVASTPAGRMSTPEDFVGAATFLASEESAHVIGQTLNVDGGQVMS